MSSRAFEAFFEDRSANFDDQLPTKKKALLKNAINLLTASTGVFIVRLTASEVLRLQSDSTDDNDPLKVALFDVNETFASCVDQSIDIRSSIYSMLQEHQHNTKINGCVLLAWRLMRCNRAGRIDMRAIPELVGIAVCSDFLDTDNYSTSKRKTNDYRTLSTYFKAYYYIDTLCSKSFYVGRILTLHAYDIAHRKGKRGIVALSYMSRERHDRREQPLSKPMFEELGFTAFIPKANFKCHDYGTWFVKDAYDMTGLHNVSTLMGLCTRTGLTRTTEDKLIGRCPL